MNTPQSASRSAIASNYLARSLLETQVATLRRCHAYDAKAITTRQIVYTGMTALKLCRLEIPQTSRLTDHEFRIAYIDRNKRSPRKHTGHLRWNFQAVPDARHDGPASSTDRKAPSSQRKNDIITVIPDAENMRFPWQHHDIVCTHPLTTWAMLAPYLNQVETIVLADAMLRGTACPISITTDDIIGFLHRVDFPGKKRCLAALPFLGSVTDSPMEARALLAILRYGLGKPQLQWRIYIPELDWTATVDMAYPEQRVIIEYDGDAHRVDKRQYRWDERKRQALRAMGFIVIVVFADDVLTAEGRAAFAKKVASALGTTISDRPLPQYRVLLDDDRREMHRDQQRRYRLRQRAQGRKV